MPHFKPTWPQMQAKGWENIRNTQAQLGPLGIALLEKLMVYNPRQRASARQVLHHEYLAAPLDTDEGATEERVRICSCGNQNMGDSEFCRKCGKRWVEEVPPVAVAPPPAIVAGPHSECPHCPSMVWQLPGPQGGLCTACGAEVWHLYDVELPAAAAPLDTDEVATELLAQPTAIVAGPHSECPHCPSMVCQGLCTACGEEVWLAEG